MSFSPWLLPVSPSSLSSLLYLTPQPPPQGFPEAFSCHCESFHCSLGSYRPQCCGLGMAFLWSGRGCPGAGPSGPMWGCGKNPEKGGGWQGDMDRRWSQTRRPLRLRGSQAGFSQCPLSQHPAGCMSPAHLSLHSLLPLGFLEACSCQEWAVRLRAS